MTDTARTPRRKHNPAWQDTTNAQRQAARLAKLNEAAQAAGFDTWRKLETAVVNGATVAVTRIDLDQQEPT